MKQKNRIESYPFLEHFLALWMDAAEYARVPVTDEIIRTQAKIIQTKLENAGVEEPYDGFEMSNGWTQRFKNRHNFGRLRAHGQSGEVDQSALPEQRQTLARDLAPFAPCDRYNCDESGLVFNKQPQSSNVRLEKGKQLRGGKNPKTRITTFHIVNESGTDKRKIWVVGRAGKPHCFRQQRVNPDNLPVVYRFNSKAWLLTGLWYEFLRRLNEEMRISQRQIALVTDNCPTHPRPDSPPIEYSGPTPPVLTNIKLIYLPPCTTSFLQPLDCGIIASFKASYKRLYAEYMVQHFNLHGERPPKIDILQAIYLIASAWDSVSPETIKNCWTKANITTTTTAHPAHYDENLTEGFISSQRRGFLEAWTTLDGSQQSSDFFDSYFDDSDEDPSPLEQASQVPDATAIVERGIKAGVLHCSATQLDKIDYDSEHDEPQLFPLPLIGLETAIHYTGELARFLQALETTTLHFPKPSGNGKSPTPVDQLVSSMQDLNSALVKYISPTILPPPSLPSPTDPSYAFSF